MNARLVLALGLSLVSATATLAQRPNRQMGRGGQPQMDPRRAELEDEVRRNFARAVRERVGLSDEQMAKLGPITRKFEGQRRETQSAERDARTKLQGLVMVNSESDSVRIKQHIGELNEVRRRRFQIDETEQRELGEIMTPLQLAKFMAIQEQIRRRLEQMRPGPGGPPGGPPDGRPGGMPPAEVSAMQEFGNGRDSMTVRLQASPRTTRILVDGVEVGMGRAQAKLSYGPHRVTLSAPGCKTSEMSINVTKGLSAVTAPALSCQ